jgi:hypothetical protein
MSITPVTVSLYRDGKFCTRMIRVLPRTARATVEDWMAGGVPFPPGAYEARLTRNGRTIKVYRWISGELNGTNDSARLRSYSPIA